MNYKKYFGIAVLLIMLFPLHVSGETIATEEWVKRYDSGYPTTMAVDSQGNIYVTGTSNGDYTTIKYDTNGNEVWVKRYDSGGNDYAIGIAVDSSDNVYVTGYGDNAYITVKYDNSNEIWVKKYPVDYAGGEEHIPHIAVDSSGSVYIASSVRASLGYHVVNYLVIKYDTDGNELWASQYDGGEDDWLYALTVDSSGNVYVAGGTSCPCDYVTVKYDSNGNAVWVNKYDSGGTEDYARTIAIDSSGNVYVTGYNGSSTGRYLTNFTTIKYDANGNEIWAKEHNTPPLWEYYDLAIDSSGNVYVMTTAANSKDYLLVKYDANGNEIWVKQYDNGSSDYARSIAVDSSGGIYVTGSSWNNNNSTYDYATVKYDTNGNEVWVKRYDSGSNEVATAFALDSSGNIYVTGYDSGYLTIKYKQSSLTPSALTSVVNGMVSSGDITNSGLANSLISLLNNAQTLITTNTTAAKNILEAVINKIEAQSGKQITTNAATELTGYLNSIIDGL